MPDLAAALHHRWFRLRWPGQKETTYAWAEKFCDFPAEASASCKRRRAEDPSGPLDPPLASHADAGVWAVCVDPV